MSVLLKVVDAKGSATGEVELQEAWLERTSAGLENVECGSVGGGLTQTRSRA